MSQAQFFASVRKAAAWSALAKWLDLGLGIITTIVLVRLLGPETFGIYGMVLAILALPEAVVSGALSESLIQRREIDREQTSATFVAELGLALLLAALLTIASPLLAAYFSTPRLALLVPVMAATLVLSALGSVPGSLLQRDLNYAALTAVDASSAILAAIVGMVGAVYGLGPWALVLMEVVRRCVRAGGLLIAARFTPCLPSSLASACQALVGLMRFNLLTLLTRLLVQADGAAPRLIIGASLGPQALGYFNLAQRLFKQASAALIAPLNTIAMPVAARSQTDPELVRTALRQATRITSFVAFPAFLGAAALMPVLVPIAFGPDWIAAIPIMQLSLLSGIRAASASFNGGILRGMGRPGWQTAQVAIGLALTGLAILVALPFGLLAVTFALFLKGLITWAIAARAVERCTHYPARDQFLIGWRSLVAASFMAGMVLWVGHLSGPFVPAPILLGLLLATGLLSHALGLAMLAWVWPPEARESSLKTGWRGMAQRVLAMA